MDPSIFTLSLSHTHAHTPHVHSPCPTSPPARAARGSASGAAPGGCGNTPRQRAAPTRRRRRVGLVVCFRGWAGGMGLFLGGGGGCWVLHDVGLVDLPFPFMPCSILFFLTHQHTNIFKQKCAADSSEALNLVGHFVRDCVGHGVRTQVGGGGDGGITETQLNPQKPLKKQNQLNPTTKTPNKTGDGRGPPRRERGGREAMGGAPGG